MVGIVATFCIVTKRRSKTETPATSIFTRCWTLRSLCSAMSSSLAWGSLVRKRKRELEMSGEWGAVALFGYCLDTVPLMLHWPQTGRGRGRSYIGWGGGGGFLMVTGERLAHTAYFLLVWTGKRVVPGECYRKRERGRVGSCPFSSVFSSQPCSRARWSNERAGASNKLRPDGERILPHNYSAAQSMRAGAASPPQRKHNHWLFLESA